MVKSGAYGNRLLVKISLAECILVVDEAEGS